MSTLKIGIVGAGLNSDYHITFSRTYDGARIVAVADSDLERAERCAARHGIPAAVRSVADMLRDASPDLVHVVTPPRTHFAVVREVLEAGRHVLVEKPMALNSQEADALYEIAERRGVHLCPMHNHLFDPCMQRADTAVKSGALGRVINVESYYGLNTAIAAFRDYPKPNVLPWLYNLPGGVYQDFLPHPLYVLLEYTGRPRNLTVMHRSTGVLPQELPDEIRILVDGEQAFGTVTFSFAAKPHLHFLRVYGTAGMVDVNFNTMATVFHPVSSLPKAAQKATYGLSESWQQTAATISNTVRFLTGRLKPYHGMKTLIHRFYDATTRGTALPVSRAQALAVVNTMDAVFEQMKYEPLRHERISAAPRALKKADRRQILVTGGTGFVGRNVVKRLVADGHHVRVLARKLARIDHLKDAGAEIYWGDIADLQSFAEAFDERDVVIHLAAGTSGTEKDSQTSTIEGTRNLLELARRSKGTRLIYVSSCSVYGVADCETNALVSEHATLERFPERRGSYSASKQQAEREVESFMRGGEGSVVILRPGTIYGPGGEVYTPMMGFSIGRLFVVIGRGKFILPLVHVDNVVEAIVRAMAREDADGEVFNVVDPERVNKREYMDAVVRRIHPRAVVVYLPFSILYGITWMQELALKLLKRRPILSRYRLVSSQKSIVYDNRKIIERLGWQPTVGTNDALADLVRFHAAK